MTSDTSEERLRKLEAIAFAHQHLLAEILAGRIQPAAAANLLDISDMARGGPEGPEFLSDYQSEMRAIARNAESAAKRMPMTPILRWLVNLPKPDNRFRAGDTLPD